MNSEYVVRLHDLYCADYGCTEAMFIAMTPAAAGQVRLRSCGQLAPNVVAKVGRDRWSFCLLVKCNTYSRLSSVTQNSAAKIFIGSSKILARFFWFFSLKRETTQNACLFL